MSKIEQNRTRYCTIAFRCSEEEYEEIHKRIELSGLQKQDYLIKSALYQEITVIGNRLLFERLSHTLQSIESELLRIQNASEVKNLTLAYLQISNELLDGLKKADISPL